MRRRGILALLGGAVAVGPFWARAQQSMPEIGFLHQGLPEPTPMMAAFSKGLDAAGIGVERDVRIEHRWAEGQYDRLPALAKELLGQGGKPVVLAFGPTVLDPDIAFHADSCCIQTLAKGSHHWGRLREPLVKKADFRH